MFDSVRVGPQWVLERVDIEGIASAYGLTVEGKMTTLGGATNGVARVESDRGAVVVRVHRPWTTPARLASVHHIQAHLRTHGLPIPPTLVTRTGTSWTELHDRLVEVTVYVPHDGPADTWGRMGEAYEHLGRLHHALSQVPPSTLVPPPYSSYADPHVALRMLRETERAFHADQGRAGYAAATATRTAAGALLRRLAHERAHYEAALPRSIIHGDYGGENVLMRGEQVAAILDFDYMAARARIVDVAYTLYWTLDRLHVPTGVATFSKNDLARAGDLLRRYGRTASPLTAAEVTALPFEMARVPLYHIVEAGYTAAVPYTPGPVDQTLAFARHLPVAQWLVIEAERVRHLLAT